LTFDPGQAAQPRRERADIACWGKL
jgi:hypothetical protein